MRHIISFNKFSAAVNLLTQHTIFVFVCVCICVHGYFLKLSFAKIQSLACQSYIMFVNLRFSEICLTLTCSSCKHNSSLADKCFGFSFYNFSEFIYWKVL